jgi:quinolinate synthase
MKLNVNKADLNRLGFLSVKIDPEINIKSEIERLRKEKKAIILAHYYQVDEIQDIADYIGDSLALAQYTSKTKADMILLAGVRFMAETVKIINPQKKVLLPDLKAGCSLADSCKASDFIEFKKMYPDRTVVTYINTTIEIKALSDIICTSSNAAQIIESLPKNEKILFAPDRNLGNYIKDRTNRDIVVWNGACHVHKQFSLERIIKLKNDNPEAKVLAHPECEKPLLLIADYIGSTSGILKFSIEDKAQKFIVATESGILHQMKKKSPEKIFIPAPPDDSTCACNDCNFMKLNTLKKIYLALKYEMPELLIDEALRVKAEIPIQRMLHISEKLGL